MRRTGAADAVAAPSHVNADRQTPTALTVALAGYPQLASALSAPDAPSAKADWKHVYVGAGDGIVVASR